MSGLGRKHSCGDNFERKIPLIIGKVVNLEVDENFFDEEGKMDFEKAKPLSCILGPKGLTFTYLAEYGKSADYSEMFLKEKEILSLRA